jgi:cobalt-zinc-cadmium efflux system membrane fusion protein
MLRRTATLLVVFSGCLVGCNQPSTQPVAEKPAKVEAHPSESDIYRITLTPKAGERLQISTVLAERRSMSRVRSLGGALVIPDGRRIPVTAPLAGTLLEANDGQPLPMPGQQVKTNQLLLRLSPMLRPELEVPGVAERVQMANARASLVSVQIQADGDVKQAAARVEAAEIALARARKLLVDGAGSQRDVDDALATYNIANEGLVAARQRKELLEQLTLDAESGTAPIVPIHAPNKGIIRTVSARIGQVVSAGAPLFEIVDLDRLWVQVPIYAGQVHEIDRQREAAILGLSETGNNRSARPIKAPPTADPLAASVDLYYEIDNSDGRFRPGERVTARVPVRGEEASLVVPRAAVLRDIHGTPWVYVRSGDNEFRRQRVAVQFTTEDLAVLSLGPEVGTSVVVDGAAELFGTEFGAGK